MKIIMKMFINMGFLASIVLFVVVFCGQVSAMGQLSATRLRQIRQIRQIVSNKTIKEQVQKYSLEELVEHINNVKSDNINFDIYAEEAIRRINGIINVFYSIKKKHLEWLNNNKGYYTGWRSMFQSSLPGIDSIDYSAFATLHDDESKKIMQKFINSFNRDSQSVLYNIVYVSKYLVPMTEIDIKTRIAEENGFFFLLKDDVLVNEGTVKNMLDVMVDKLCEFFSKYMLDDFYVAKNRNDVDKFCSDRKKTKGLYQENK